MDDGDLRVRNATYRLFVAHGRAPTIDEVAAFTAGSVEPTRAAWRRLHEAHAIVLQPGGDELRMANPFSAVPTNHRVWADGRWWDANCAWDAVGVCAALGVDGRIETSCPDCASRLVVEVHDGAPDDETLLFHCLVPATEWWSDIVFT